MNTDTIIQYLYDLIDEINDNKKNNRYICWKIKTLIFNLKKIPKIEIKQPKKPITNKPSINLTENKITEKIDYYI